MEEKNCTITLIDAGTNRVPTIKILREFFGLGVKEANDIVNFMPYTFQQKYTTDFAKDLENQLSSVGATVKLEIDTPAYDPLTYDAPTNNLGSTDTSNTVTDNARDTNSSVTLKQYLKDVYLLESTLHSYRCMKDKYNKQIQNLLFIPSVHDEIHAQKKVYRKEWLNSDAYKKQHAEFKSEVNKRRLIAVIFGLIAFVIALIAFHCIAAFENEEAFITYGKVVGIFAAILVYLIVCKITGVKKYTTYIENMTNVSHRHMSGVYESGDFYYEKWRISQLCAEVEARKPLANHLKKQLNDEILPQEEQVQRLLAHVYCNNVIHPKYRNFLAVAQILEYLDTGRCTELGGPNGAYNLYEQELRQNIIIDRLDQVINQLDRLNRTMGYVASAITQSNRLLGDISNSLGRIEANTALTAYNTQCIANNTSIANRYNYR